jgi:hypothetical protein
MNNRTRTVALGLGAALFFSGSAAGAQKAELADEVEIIRSEVDITRPHPVPPTIESVLVFTNWGIVPRRVHCVAWNKNGAVVGRVRTLVPLTTCLPIDPRDPPGARLAGLRALGTLRVAVDTRRTGAKRR